MVVIQENETYFVSSRLHLPHGVGEQAPTATYCQINDVITIGLSWNGRCSALSCHIPQTGCCLFVTKKQIESICWYPDGTEGLRKISGVKLLQDQTDLWNFIFTDEATVPCCCKPYRNIPLALSPLQSALGLSGQWVSGLYCNSEIKSAVVSYREYWLQEGNYSHDVLLQSC